MLLPCVLTQLPYSYIKIQQSCLPQIMRKGQNVSIAMKDSRLLDVSSKTAKIKFKNLKV